MNLVPKVILATLFVLMISSGLVLAPSYAAALTFKYTAKSTFTVPTAMKCPNGSLAPDNSVSKCPALVPSKSDNQSPQNSNYKAQATYVQNGGTSYAGVIAQQATQARSSLRCRASGADAQLRIGIFVPAEKARHRARS